MKLGVIGYGNRIQSMVNEVMRVAPETQVVSVCDPDEERVSAQFEQMGSPAPRIFTSVEDMLSSSSLDGVMIGTRCSLHTPIALQVLPTNLPLFLEKPVATNDHDLALLEAAGRKRGDTVVVSFPLRLTPLVTLAKEIIDSGKIGQIEHAQMINNVPYGSVYYQNWYRDEEETGGLFLQKATHDFDYLNSILGYAPTQICAMTSKQIFKGEKPVGLTCPSCDENHICPESSVLKRLRGEVPEGEQCCFAVDTGNEDSGSAIVRYETGMHAVYSQNFFARNASAARGVKLLGFKGTLEFDFYTNVIKVYMHHTPRVETYEVSSGGVHSGGDAALAANFVDVIAGRASSLAPLEAGIVSATMCLRARESAATSSFQNIAIHANSLAI